MLSANDYKILVEQSPILIWRANTEKLCDYFNERWLSFTGRSFEQEYGHGWTEGVHSDDLKRCVDIYIENFDQRKIFEMRYRLKRHDGEYRWIFDRGVPFFDDHGVFAGYIGSCIDITENVNAEFELKRINEEKIRQLEKLLPICAWCKDIRDEQGDWMSLEKYIHSTNKETLTHTICPECKKKMGPSSK